MRIAVIGAGGWGTALATLVATAGHQVCVWVRRRALYEQLSKEQQNAVYLPNVRLPSTLTYTTALAEAVAQAELIILAVPSHALRGVAHSLASVLTGTPLLVSATKGIEEESLQTMTTVLSEELPIAIRSHISVLSGPSFATEVARGLPTAVTVAARHEAVATDTQKVFSSSRFRVYTTTDVVGVEIGGAVKNVIAIAAGVSDGLGSGYSARAALITRGLAEMTRLAVRLGATSQTLSGLSGIGDLVLTCTSDLSRNRTVGVRIGRREKVSDILNSMTMVAEGVRTCRSVYALAQRLGIDMPIIEQVYALLYEEKSPQQVVVDLLTRESKPEFWRREN